jgi:pimeloyl-ACP methyl ester carboxylesterase
MPRSPIGLVFEARRQGTVCGQAVRETCRLTELRRDPSAIEHLGIGEIVDYYDALVRELDSPPIIVGHSFGGAFTEILVDRGLGAAGVAIDAAAVRGISSCPSRSSGLAFPCSRTHPTSTRPSP